MTKKDFLRELKSYFPDIDWTPAAESRVNILLEAYHTSAKTLTLVKHIYVDREVVVEGTCARESDYAKIAEDVCKKHNIPLEQLKVSSPNWAYKNGRKGTRELVDARHEFVNKVFTKFPHSSKVQTSRWLGYTCHSSVYHLINKRKI